MQRLYFILILFVPAFFCSYEVQAQDKDTTVQPNTLDPDLLNIFNQKTPKKYKIAGIKVTGNNFFDEALLLSVSSLSVGEEITIPGGDNFSKAITKLWSQNYFSDVAIYITRLEENSIYLEINVTERPRLSRFFLRNISKSEQDDLGPKTGLVIGRVVTENMKRSAIDAVNKFYFEKGFRNIKTSIEIVPDTAYQNSVILNLYIDKGYKVKINNVNFVNNSIDELKLKRQMKGTKEMTRITPHPTVDSGGLANPGKYTFNE